MPNPTRQEWFFACLKGTLASYLRPARFSRVTLQQVDGLKRRIQIACGVSEEEIKQVIASLIDAIPYSDSERLNEIRRKYWPKQDNLPPGFDLQPRSGGGNGSANHIRAKLQCEPTRK